MSLLSLRAPVRPVALLAAATGLALVGALLVPAPAGAAVTGTNPSSGFNSEAEKSVVIETDAAQGTDYRSGGSARFVLSGTPSASLTVMIPPGTSARMPTVELNLLDGGDGLGVDGPVDAGSYDITTTATGVPVVGTGAGTDSGTSMFQVQAAVAPALGDLAPSSLRAGSAVDVTLTGAGFERGMRIEFLRGGAVDPSFTVRAPLDDPQTPQAQADESAQGITTPGSAKRRITIAAGAVTGARDVRLAFLNGRTATCTACFSVDGAPLTSTTPAGGDNDPALGPVAITFTGTGLNTAGVPQLLYSGAASTTPSPRDSLTILGTNVRNASATSITADFDLRNAGPQAYQPVVRNPDGSANACACRFTIAQNPTRTTTVTGVDTEPSTAGSQTSQPQGTSRVVLVNGTGLSKGLRVLFSGAGVTAGPVELLSATQVRVTVTTTAAAAAGARNVTVQRTDGTTSAACTGCYTVTAATPSPTPTGTVVPGGKPATPTVAISPGTITSQQTATVSGTAEPNATIELWAYSRPSTTFVRVRSDRVSSAGNWTFTVKPSGNTRLFARVINAQGATDSPSQVLFVRTGINLKVARLDTLTYRFSGSTLPKRAGQLVTVFYETSGGRTITARARVAADGTYQVVRTFTGTGTFRFYTATGTDINNLAGETTRVTVTLR